MREIATFLCLFLAFWPTQSCTPPVTTSCTFNSMLDNTAAFPAGTNPCTTGDCTGTACSCTMADGATATVSANQCADNASFCITSNGAVQQVTAPVAGSTLSCSNGVATLTDVNGATVSPIELVACSVIVSTPPPVFGCA